jgi:hypothetical protein
MKVVHHLFARPVLFVHTRIDDQANGSPHLVFQAAIIAVTILIVTDFLGEVLGNCALPLDVLDWEVGAWISAQVSR